METNKTYDQIFKNHVAELKELDDDTQVLSFKDPNSKYYGAEFLFRNKSIPAQYRKFKYFILMLIKYDLADDKIPEMNANKMNKFCEKILAMACF